MCGVGPTFVTEIRLATDLQIDSQIYTNLVFSWVENLQPMRNTLTHKQTPTIHHHNPIVIIVIVIIIIIIIIINQTNNTKLSGGFFNLLACLAN